MSARRHRDSTLLWRHVNTMFPVEYVDSALVTSPVFSWACKYTDRKCVYNICDRELKSWHTLRVVIHNIDMSQRDKYPPQQQPLGHGQQLCEAYPIQVPREMLW